ncbi:hypothetical protein [Aquipseudomonas campi]
MTSINTSTPAMASYYASQANNNPSKAKADGDSSPSKDVLTELRRYAKETVAHGEGGLMRALKGAGALQSPSALQMTGLAESSSGGAPRMQLPDVAQLERDDAGKLLKQVQELVDAGLEGAIRFNGSNGDKQTDSLETYRQWLQEKAGISVYI